MDINHIIVQLDEQPGRNESRIYAAMQLAKQTGASVTGCLIEQSIDFDGTNIVRLSNSNHIACDHFYQLHDAEFSQIPVSFEQHQGKAADILGQRIEQFDLLVMDHHCMEQGPLGHFYTLASSIAANSGKLVLMVPDNYQGKGCSIGSLPLIAWSQHGRIHDIFEHTQSILQRAHQIKVVLNSIGSANEDLMDAEPMPKNTLPFDVHTEIEKWHTGLQDYPERLLALAVNHDLIIMNANGHTNLKEVLVGETTREMLRTSPLPVLLTAV